MEYLVQAILVDGSIETVTESIKTCEPMVMITMLMMKHQHSTHYIYKVMDIKTGEIVLMSNKNLMGY